MPIIKTPEQIFDVRLQEHHLSKKLIKEKDIKKFIKNLPDVGDDYEMITKEMIFDELKPEEPEELDVEEESEIEE